MLMPPSLPAWNAIHPLVVHFPIALSFVAPIFVGAAVFLPRRAGTASACCGLLLLVMAAASMFVATATGEAAEELAERAVGGAAAALERHEDFAVTARALFLVLAVMLAMIEGAFALLGRRRPVRMWIRRAARATVVLLCLPALLVLMNAAHAGGQLVHGYGIRAAIGGDPATLPAPAPTRVDHDDDD
ncbi:MAG: hypothetical protein KDA21_01890 [Phycisphaerales bacterium]|nr:hypothetical protein [Phycisphaerales bacterium]